MVKQQGRINFIRTGCTVLAFVLAQVGIAGAHGGAVDFVSSTVSCAEGDVETQRIYVGNDCEHNVPGHFHVRSPGTDDIVRRSFVPGSNYVNLASFEDIAVIRVDVRDPADAECIVVDPMLNACR